MRSRWITSLLGAAVVFSLSSCQSGPSYCQRTVDDWQNADYTENPLRTAVITDVLPGYPLLKVIAFIPDFLVLNPVQFWVFDLWRAEGAGYIHENPQPEHETWFASEIDRGRNRQ